MDISVSFSDDSKESIWTRSLASKIQNISRRLELDERTEPFIMNGMSPRWSPSSLTNRRVLSASDVVSANGCPTNTYSRETSIASLSSRPTTSSYTTVGDYSALNLRLPPSAFIHPSWDITHNQTALPHYQGDTAQNFPSSSHRREEVAPFAFRNEFHESYIRRPQEASAVQGASSVPSYMSHHALFTQSPIPPPAGFSDISVTNTWLNFSIPSPEKPLDLSRKNQVLVPFVKTEANFSEVEQHGNQPQSRWIKEEANANSVEPENHVDTIPYTDIKQSTSMLEEEAHITDYARSQSTVFDDTVERAMMILNQVPSLSSMAGMNTSDSSSQCESYRLLLFCDCVKSLEAGVPKKVCHCSHSAFAVSSGSEKKGDYENLHTADSEQIDMSIASYKKQPVPSAQLPTSHSLQEPVNTGNDSISSKDEASVVTSYADWTFASSSESSSLPSLSFLQPKTKEQSSPHPSTNDKDVTLTIDPSPSKTHDVYDFTSDEEHCVLPSLTHMRSQNGIQEHSLPETNQHCDGARKVSTTNSVLLPDETVSQNNTSEVSSLASDTSAAEQDSQAYYGDESQTTSNMMEITSEASLGTWSVKSAVESCSSTSLKLTLCKAQNSTTDPSQQTDEGNTAFLATGSESSESSCHSSATSQNEREVEGSSFSEASAIISQPSQHPITNNFASFCLSYPSTPELSLPIRSSLGHSKLPPVIVRRKPDHYYAEQKSSTPRPSEDNHLSPIITAGRTATQGLHKLLLKKRLFKRQGSDSILNLGFSIDNEEDMNCKSFIDDTMKQPSSDKHASHHGKRPKKSFIQSLKRQLCCGKSNVSLMSVHDVTAPVNCLGYPQSKPERAPDLTVPTSTRPMPKLPICGKATTSTATLKLVTVSSPSVSSAKKVDSTYDSIKSTDESTNMQPCHPAQPETHSQSALSLPSVSSTKKVDSTYYNICVKSTDESTYLQPCHLAQPETHLPSALKNAGTSTLPNSASVILPPKVAQEKLKSGSCNMKGHSQSSAGAIHAKSDLCGRINNKTYVVAQGNSPSSTQAPVFKVPRVPKIADRKLSRIQSNKKCSDPVRTGASPKKNGDEVFKIPIDPQVFLAKKQRRPNSSSHGPMKSHGISGRRQLDSKQSAHLEGMDILKVKEGGRTSAELLATFVNDKDLKKFQTRCDGPTGKKILSYLCQRCDILVRSSETDPFLITLSKTTFSRAPTEYDVQQLIRTTRRH